MRIAEYALLVCMRIRASPDNTLSNSFHPMLLSSSNTRYLRFVAIESTASQPKSQYTKQSIGICWLRTSNSLHSSPPQHITAESRHQYELNLASPSPCPRIIVHDPGNACACQMGTSTHRRSKTCVLVRQYWRAWYYQGYCLHVVSFPQDDRDRPTRVSSGPARRDDHGAL